MRTGILRGDFTLHAPDVYSMPMIPMEKRTGRSAFTLVELLVVVSIIALLASFILPGLSRAREYAYFTTCKNSQRQLGIGLLMFASDNRGRPPDAYDKCGGPPAGANSVRRYRRAGRIETMRKWEGNRWSLQQAFLTQFYNGDGNWGPYGSGWDWDDNPAGNWTSHPRLPGLYGIPIEGLWDPIIKVRGWLFGEDTSSRCYPSDTEQQRDNNPTTNNQQVRSSSPGSCWVAACLPAFTGTYGSLWRRNASHFGVARTTAGDYRFNVLHIDGHVHDDVWRSHEIRYYWRVLSGFSSDWGERPYGWRYQAGRVGVEPEPDFVGPFDRNP